MCLVHERLTNYEGVSTTTAAARLIARLRCGVRLGLDTTPTDEQVLAVMERLRQKRAVFPLAYIEQMSGDNPFCWDVDEWRRLMTSVGPDSAGLG